MCLKPKSTPMAQPVLSGRSRCSGRLSRRQGAFPHPGNLRPRIYWAAARGTLRPAEIQILTNRTTLDMVGLNSTREDNQACQGGRGETGVHKMSAAKVPLTALREDVSTGFEPQRRAVNEVDEACLNAGGKGVRGGGSPKWAGPFCALRPVLGSQFARDTAKGEQTGTRPNFEEPSLTVGGKGGGVGGQSSGVPAGYSLVRQSCAGSQGRKCHGLHLGRQLGASIAPKPGMLTLRG